MFGYFNDCKCIEVVKERFRDLAKRLHPDNGGDAEKFKAMMGEYTEVFKRLRNIHRTEEFNGQPHKESKEIPEAFAEIILKVIHMDGVTIEIIGSWVWLSGNTYPYKDQIKAAGFWYSKSKKAWYWTGQNEPHKPRYRARHTMNGIRNMWGSEIISTETQPLLTT